MSEKRKAYSIAGEILAILEDKWIEETNTNVTLETTPFFGGSVYFRLHCIDSHGHRGGMIHALPVCGLLDACLTPDQWARIVYESFVERIRAHNAELEADIEVNE